MMTPEERAAYARKAKPPWDLEAAEGEIARLREELRLNADALEASEQQVANLQAAHRLHGHEAGYHWHKFPLAAMREETT